MTPQPPDRPSVVVVVLTYVADLAEVDALLPRHVAWLDSQYDDGALLLNGPRVPRVGGVLVFSGTTVDDVRSRLADDPFARHGVATYEVLEVAASRARADLAPLLGLGEPAAAGDR